MSRGRDETHAVVSTPIASMKDQVRAMTARNAVTHYVTFQNNYFVTFHCGTER